MKEKIYPFVIVLLILSARLLYPQGIPETINFQGVLKDASGNVVANGDYNLTFSCIGSAETGISC